MDAAGGACFGMTKIYHCRTIAAFQQKLHKQLTQTLLKKKNALTVKINLILTSYEIVCFTQKI